MFRSVWRIMTGEVVKRVDSPTGVGLTMSVRLKRERGTNESYVVIASNSPGVNWYSDLTKDEFLEFASAVEQVKRSILTM
jgi:hypothetical protein